MIRTVITGATGRMGSTLVRAVLADRDLVLAGATERPGSPGVGQDAGSGVRVADTLAAALGPGADVVIDFTGADASLAHAKTCADQSVALVIGSTGFSNEAKAELARLAARTRIVLAPNMSVGVNVVMKIAADLARALGEDFDIEIVETHHRMKKDAPSGTALKLAEEVARARGQNSSAFTFARQGEVGARPKGEIGLQTLRGGDVVGDHTVFFLSDGERVELSHRATSRDQFAKGALRAAKWVVGQKPGLYDMQDVLGLKEPGNRTPAPTR